MTPTDEFEGMTAVDCATACNETDGCVISGINHCAHPRKSGLQSVHRMMPDVLERYERASKLLKLKDAITKYEHGSAPPRSSDMVAGPSPSAVLN
jgi:hypothetical protein